MRFFALVAVCIFSLGSVFAQLAPLPPDGFVTLEQILGDFASQQTAAVQKYQGMRVTVYGRVGQVGVDDDLDGDPLAVYMQMAQNPTPDVKAVFADDDVPQSAELEVSDDQSQAIAFHRDMDGNIVSQRPFVVVGENVAITGTFDNFEAGDIVLKNCRKLGPERLTELLEQHGIEP
jgi:hypothetical protein